MKNNIKAIYAVILVTVICFNSCKSGPFSVFKTASPHEIYERKLESSGLSQTAMGRSWIVLSKEILLKPVSIKIPYRETGYFPAQKVRAAAFSFNMVRGQKLHVKVTKKPMDNFMIYADVWQREEGGDLEILSSADTLGNSLKADINKTATYILRIQPELLAGGEYTLEIISGPSLPYPLKTYQNNQIRSFWGDGRDENSRKHEGVDIFSSFRTPVLAIAPGTARVNENSLGGKVVWLRPEDREISLYYAHLDEQTVRDGQAVQTGDTLGLMGNTGNARTTPPHLHFGIYTRNGAVNPLPFINPKIEEIPAVRSDTSLLNATLRTSGNASFIHAGAGLNVPLKAGTVVQPMAAYASSFRVELPDGRAGYLAANKLSETSRPIQKRKIDSIQLNLYDRPDSSAAVKLRLKGGQTIEVLGNFNDYQFVRWQDETGWIKR